MNKYWQWRAVLAIKEVHTRCNGITEKLPFIFAQSNWKRCHWIFGLSTFFFFSDDILINSLDWPEHIFVLSLQKHLPTSTPLHAPCTQYLNLFCARYWVKFLSPPFFFSLKISSPHLQSDKTSNFLTSFESTVKSQGSLPTCF